MLLIFWSIFVFDKQTPFPSLWTVLPVGGTVLILLYAASGTAVARLLSLRPMVWVGLISYSAYLIHQPLFAFARIRSIGEPDHLLMYGLAALTFPLAYASWRFVEQPFRKSGTISKRAIFAGSTVGLLAFIAVGLVGHVTRGLPDRLSKEVVAMAEVGQERNPRRDACLTWDVPEAFNPRCSSEGTPKVALIGDSHADALATALHPALHEAGYGVYEATATGCWPLPGFRRENDVQAKCSRRNDGVRALLDRADYDVVVVTARWTVNLLGTRFDNGVGGVEPAGLPPSVEILGWEGRFGAPESSERRARMLTQMETELRRRLDRHRIVLVYPIPEAGWDVPQVAARGALYGDLRDLSTSYDLYKNRNADIIYLFESINHPNLYRVRPEEVFCRGEQPGRCMTISEGQPLYRDDDHLSRAGGQMLVPLILNVLSTLLLDSDV